MKPPPKPLNVNQAEVMQLINPDNMKPPPKPMNLNLTPHTRNPAHKQGGVSADRIKKKQAESVLIKTEALVAHIASDVSGSEYPCVYVYIREREKENREKKKIQVRGSFYIRGCQ